MNIYVQTSVWTYFSFLSGDTRNGLLGHSKSRFNYFFHFICFAFLFCATFKETVELSPKVAAPFYIPMLFIYNETR